jgi:AmpE protein
MYLMIILLAMGLQQLLGDVNLSVQDQWLQRMRTTVAHKFGQFPHLQLLAVVAIPVVLVGWVGWLLPMFLWFVLAVAVLLYSLGRGEFAPHVRSYTVSCSENNWSDALDKARAQGVDTEGIAVDDWATLNHKMVDAVAYQGFERLFAVIFWFVLLGPAGALAYRLSYFHAQGEQDAVNQPVSKRWLWAMEWPAVRLLGLSFAITGNFVSCMERWRNHFFNVESPSSLVLRETALGAVSADESMEQSCACTQREVSALKRLYARTFWFWLGALAVVILLSGGKVSGA